MDYSTDADLQYKCIVVETWVLLLTASFLEYDELILL